MYTTHDNRASAWQLNSMLRLISVIDLNMQHMHGSWVHNSVTQIDSKFNFYSASYSRLSPEQILDLYGLRNSD